MKIGICCFHWVVLWIGLALQSLGCATYSAYRCPQPIGEIVRQDCEDFRVRYQSLQTSLKLSLGGVGVSLSTGAQNLRDPSELVQLMLTQMLSLCHDFNACRVRPEDYQRQREQADRRFTALLALLEQARNASLSSEERKIWLDRLMAVLVVGPVQPNSSATSPEKSPSPPPEKAHAPKEGFFRNPTGFWFGTRFLPPQPARLAPGVPVVLDVEPIREKQIIIRLIVDLWGPIEEDDTFELVAGTERTRCELTVRGKGPRAQARCEPKGVGGFSANSLRVAYRLGSNGQSYDLGVLAWETSEQLQRVWLAYQPDPVRVDPVQRERPWLIVTLPATKRASVTARCTLNGRPVAVNGVAVFQASSDTGRAYGSSVAQYAIPLPYVMPYPQSAASEDAPFGTASGEWHCRISLDGTPQLEARFILTPAGIPVPHSTQTGKPGGLAFPWWRIDPIGPDKLTPATGLQQSEQSWEHT